MKFLEQTYTAVSVKGHEFHVLDIENLIRDYGATYFLTHFGLYHDVIVVDKDEFGEPITDILYELGSGRLKHKPLAYGSDTFYRFEYILVNGLGKAVDPMTLLVEFDSRYPGELTRRYRRRSRKRYRDGKGYGSRHQVLKQALGVVKEDGEPELRRRTWTCDFSHFDDPWFKSRSKENWKKYRKTQYRT